MILRAIEAALGVAARSDDVEVPNDDDAFKLLANCALFSLSHCMSKLAPLANEIRRNTKSLASVF